MAAEMKTEASLEKKVSRVWLPRLTLIVVTILILSNLAAALMAAAYQIYHDGLIYPGVSVWGIDLSGMTPAEAALALNGQFTYPQDTLITFTDGDAAWQISTAQLGVSFDVERTVQAAYDVGRHPELVTSMKQQSGAWRNGMDISPVIVFNQMAADTYIRGIAGQVDRPTIDATITVVGLGATTTPSQLGRTVDIPTTLTGLGLQIVKLESGEVPLVITETQATIVSTEEVAEQIQTILSADMEVYIEDAALDDPGPWIASREALAGMLILDLASDDGGATAYYTIQINQDQLTAFLNPLSPMLEREPLDARFEFNDGEGTVSAITESLDGRALDIPSTIQMINQRAINGEHRAPLIFTTTIPMIPDTATAEELGVIELVASATTYYYGSSANRRENVSVAAARLHGAVVGPGEVFSFNHFLGDVSLESGFEESMIIFNGRTIKGVGGGVCQVSTTIFQAAFYAGVPVVERYPHGYFVSYYEIGEGPGLDATVYEPVVDFKFRNDYPSHLLVETYTDTVNQTVTFRFYATSDGRTVQKDGPYISNKVPHGPAIYEESADLGSGQRKQVDWAVDGFDVIVNRIVYRDGEIILQDSFLSQYVPWQSVYQVAPGELPPGAAYSAPGYGSPTPN